MKSIKKVLLLVLYLFLINYTANSQDNKSEKAADNAIYLEIHGVGGYGSVNYERNVFRKSNIKIALRIGFSTIHFYDFTNKFNPDLIIPLLINGLYGNKHNIEFGIGQTFSSIVQSNSTDYFPARENSFSTNFTLGYRYQKPSGGIIFRIAYTPVIEKNKSYRHWGGISIGYAF